MRKSEEGRKLVCCAEDINILCDTVCEMDKGVLTKLDGWKA